MTAQKLLQRVVPVVVSIAALTYVFADFDVRVLSELSWQIVLVMLPAVLGYGAVTLLIEAVSLMRLIDPPASFTSLTAAKIKSASYLLGILNYALGGAALTILLRRRARLGLGESASVVVLISAADLVVVTAFLSVGLAFAESGDAVVRTGVVTLVGIGFFGGMLLLRTPYSLGPLERIRSLAIFDALRTTPADRLGQLLLLRAVFSVCFVAVGGASFAAFQVPVEIGRLVVGMMILAVIGALPIAVAGLGTGQIAAVYVFKDVAPPEMLITISLVLSGGLIALRAALGILFAREYTREALQETRAAGDWKKS
ncbi:MAG: hypothetical protein E2O69_07985 [Deltaproteobacteria bacterium]|nr:MAG: hypothetical protein E2O69_07985 [Deltaproteobacteria bacterium]